MAVTKIKPIKSTLSKALDYIENPDKTDGKMLVSSFGCSYETADIEFGFTLSQALDKGNNVAHHIICRFVRLKATLVFTLDRSLGTGTYAKKKPPFCLSGR